MLASMMFSSTVLGTWQIFEMVFYMFEEDTVVGKVSDLFQGPQSVAELD